ncbi:MAG TPA: class I SAM-dependent methyltransferase [Sphingomicrobium sp.]|nr:class I SAM-dependent methyltransferase [Sphingomicrobium sp.]
MATPDLTVSSQPPLTTAYNERLFGRPGLRRSYHMARFNWVRGKVEANALDELRLIELGCYDGRLFETLGSKVTEYVGLDSELSLGVEVAQQKYAGRKDVTLIVADDPAALRLFADNHFNAAAALETLEHVPPHLVAHYLDELRRVTRGYLFVTVPNELGPVFLAKFLAKRLFFSGGEPYSLREIIAATFGRTRSIPRMQHKGFDYRRLLADIGERFDIVAVEGLPKLGLPALLSPTVAIFARSRADA